MWGGEKKMNQGRVHRFYPAQLEGWREREDERGANSGEKSRLVWERIHLKCFLNISEVSSGMPHGGMCRDKGEVPMLRTMILSLLQKEPVLFKVGRFLRCNMSDMFQKIFPAKTFYIVQSPKGLSFSCQNSSVPNQSRKEGYYCQYVAIGSLAILQILPI